MSSLWSSLSLPSSGFAHHKQSIMMQIEEGNQLLGSTIIRDKDVIDKCINNPRPGKDYELAFSLAMGNAADAVEIMCVGFIMSEMDDISSIDKEFLSSAVFMGMLFGGLLGGYFSDIIGRRRSLLLALLLNAVAGILSAASINMNMLICFRVIAGIGIGGSVPIVFSMGAEVFPAQRRGHLLSVIASFWMVGAIYTAFTAWILLGKDINGVRICPGGSWRIFAVVSALPAFVALCLAYYKLPESPRYLVGKGRAEEAAQCLNSISTVRVTAEELNSVKVYQQEDSSIARTVGLLFGPELKVTSIVLMGVWFTLSFGSYGISTWISVLFEDVGIGNPYAASFIYALANLPGNLVSLWLIDTYGRRSLLSWGMAMAGFSSLGFALDTEQAAVVVLFAALFNAFSTMGWNSLDCLSAEMFPTGARSTAMGLLAASGRLGAISGQFVNGTLENNIPLLLVVTTVCCIFGGCIAFALPYDSAGPLHEIVSAHGDNKSAKYTEVDKPSGDDDSVSNPLSK